MSSQTQCMPHTWHWHLESRRLQLAAIDHLWRTGRRNPRCWKRTGSHGISSHARRSGCFQYMPVSTREPLERWSHRDCQYFGRFVERSFVNFPMKSTLRVFIGVYSGIQVGSWTTTFGNTTSFSNAHGWQRQH